MVTKEKRGEISDMSLGWAVGIGFSLMSIMRFWRWFQVWIRVPVHHFVLGAVLVPLLTALFYWIARKRERFVKKRDREAAILGADENSVFCGYTDKKEEVFVKERQRGMHTQVIGTTNAGKTESVILPWAIQDMERGCGLCLIDGKADRSLLDKLWAYAVKAGREKDFRLFSLSDLEASHQFNPLVGGSPEEISERVFNAFDFENPHYRSVQYEIFSQVMRVFAASKTVPTFLRLHQAISEPERLEQLAENIPEDLKQWVSFYRNLPPKELVQRTSGLTAALSHFAFGETAALFNTEKPSITLEEALSKNQIVYFQLPVLRAPFLGKATGKMVLQSLQSAIANRHRTTGGKHRFFSVFLDDFSEYLYPGFVSVLNKSRSANIGVVFAHQALGDIQTLGDAIANSILTNANLKIFMRGNDPESAEYFAKVIGTVKATKYTERTKKGFLSNQGTGDASAREVEEFVIHPNQFKSELGVGEAIMVIPHEAGSKTTRIKFEKYDDLTAKELEPGPKETAGSLALPQKIEKISTENLGVAA
jgi:type IV secretory pathway TraG/TraD family ATPase VirD4